MLSAETLKPLLYVKSAHMTFGTCVCFSPDEGYVLSASSDASAVLTRIPRPSGGGGALTTLLLLLALLFALLAVAAGLMVHLARTQPEQLRELLEPVPPRLRDLLVHLASLPP